MSLNLLSVETLNDWIEKSGWLRISDGLIKPAKPKSVEWFEINFANDGNAAASVAELLLSDFLHERITTGIVYVYQIFPAEDAPIEMVRQLLRVHGYDDVATTEYRFRFEADYSGLLTFVTWCLACGWGFYLLPTSHRIFFKGGNEHILDVCWDKTERTKENVEQLLANISARPRAVL